MSNISFRKKLYIPVGPKHNISGIVLKLWIRFNLESDPDLVFEISYICIQLGFGLIGTRILQCKRSKEDTVFPEFRIRLNERDTDPEANIF